MDTNIPTPITDEAESEGWDSLALCVDSDVCRQLERELVILGSKLDNERVVAKKERETLIAELKFLLGLVSATNEVQEIVNKILERYKEKPRFALRDREIVNVMSFNPGPIY